LQRTRRLEALPAPSLLRKGEKGVFVSAQLCGLGSLAARRDFGVVYGEVGDGQRARGEVLWVPKTGGRCAGSGRALLSLLLLLLEKGGGEGEKCARPLVSESLQRAGGWAA